MIESHALFCADKKKVRANKQNIFEIRKMFKRACPQLLALEYCESIHAAKIVVLDVSVVNC